MLEHKEIGEVLTFCFKVSISDSWITITSVTALPRHKEILADMSGKRPLRVVHSKLSCPSQHVKTRKM